MFQPEVRDVITQRVQKVIVAVVLSAKKGSGLGHEILVTIPYFFRRLKSGCAVGDNIQFGGRLLAGRERNTFQILPHKHWRIDQHRQ